jgi:hypothetical protein
VSTRPSLLVTLLRKDLRLFWPFAALVALVQVLWQFPDLVSQLGALASVLETGMQLGTLLLIVVIVYEDAVVSLKHDWLTRPVRGPTLLLAKSLFVVGAIILPAMVGAFVYHLTQGHSIGEAVLAGLSSSADGNNLPVFIAAMAFAAITSSLRQAVIVFLAGLSVITLITVGWASLDQDVPESGAFSGSGWVMKDGVRLLMTVGAICVLWIQYRHRNTRVSRGIAVGATVLGTWIVVFMGWSPMFALQKALSPDAGAAASAQVMLAQGCFPARVLGGGEGTGTSAGSGTDTTAGTTAALTAQRYSEEHRRVAGADALAFSTRLDAQVPDGNLLVVNHVDLRYVSGGRELRRLRPGRTSSYVMRKAEAPPTADHYWLLPATDLKRLASDPGVEAHLDYSLSLLAPKNTVQFAADGSRHYYEGIGYCSAEFDRALGAVAVDCFKPGVQPAYLTANIDGTADSAATRRFPLNYAPAVLDFWGGKRTDIQLAAHGSEIPRVNVTAYEPRAHFDRQLIRPGVLGGPTSACPAP